MFLLDIHSNMDANEVFIHDIQKYGRKTQLSQISWSKYTQVNGKKTQFIEKRMSPHYIIVIHPNFLPIVIL